MKTLNSPESRSQSCPPRARVILEFAEGDLTHPPIILPQGGSDEMDEALRREVVKRWQQA